MKKYDYILAGGGMAGLSLAYYLTQSALRDKSILLVDKEPKTRNDRTWCFWERGRGPFEPIVFRSWNTVEFYGPTLAGPLDIGDYQYKMLRGVDFYAYLDTYLARFTNIERRIGTISRIQDTASGGIVVVDDEPISADFVFDSTHALNLRQPGRHTLLQHFKGWVISTQKPCFDVARPRMMDFRVAQQNDCRFFYLLPFDAHTAMVEYTIFNDQLLSPDAYDQALRTYIDTYLDTGGYQVGETEFGIIPMSDVPTAQRPSPHIVRIGTAGGYTKPSTGYTFQRTQHNLRQLVNSLAQTGRPDRPAATPVRTAFKGWLDSVLLNVLQQKRHPADAIFTRLYARNPPALVFRFLDEETSLWEDLRIMSTVPLGPFTMGALDVLRKRLG